MTETAIPTGIAFKARTSSLVAAVKLAADVIREKSPLPILSGVYLTTSWGEVTVLATDLTTWVETRCPCREDTPEEALLPALLFRDALDTFGSEDFELAPSGERVYAFVCGRNRGHFHGMDPKDYPMPLAVEGPSTTIGGGTLAAAIKAVLPAVRRLTKSDTYGPLDGALMRMRAGEITFAGADGFRLAVDTLPSDDREELTAIVPLRALELVLTLVERQGGAGAEVTVTIGPSAVRFQAGAERITTKIVDGQYPDYERVIPTDYTTVIACGAADFLDAVRVATALGENTVRLETGAGELRIGTKGSTANGADESASTIPAQITGEPLTILLGGHYLAQHTAAILAQGERMTLRCRSAAEPVIMASDPAGSQMHCLMPMTVVGQGKAAS